MSNKISGRFIVDITGAGAGAEAKGAKKKMVGKKTFLLLFYSGGDDVKGNSVEHKEISMKNDSQ